MYEYRIGSSVWLRVPLVQSRWFEGESINYTDSAIVSLENIESVRPAGEVEIDGVELSCCAIHMLSGDEFTLALSVTDFWDSLGETLRK